MAGRRPKPIALHQLSGNPSKLTQATLDATDNPRPQLGIPEKPKGMSKAAQREFDRMACLLAKMGIITVVDGLALAGYARAAAMVEIAEKEIDKNGITFITHFQNDDGQVVEGDIKANPAVAIWGTSLKIMKAFLIEFGLTPASRRNIKSVKPDEGDALDKIMKGEGTSPLLTPVSPEDMVADDDKEQD